MCKLESSKSAINDEETLNAFDFLDESYAAKRYAKTFTRRTRNTDTEKELVNELMEGIDGRTWDDVQVECHGEIDGTYRGKPVCFCELMNLTYQSYLDKWLDRPDHRFPGVEKEDLIKGWH